MMNLSMCSGLPAENYSHILSETNTLYTAGAYIFILLSAFVVSANVIVIISLLRSHLKDKSGTATNVRLVKSLMTSMAVSDAIIGAFSMPLGIYELFRDGHWGLGDDLCGIKQVTDVYLCTVSIYHVICMAVDRYLAVCKPLLYRTLTMRASYYMIGVCWTIPGILCLILFLNDWGLTGITDIAMCFKMNDFCFMIVSLPHQVVSVIISFYIPFVIMYVLYFLIARDVWRVYSRKPQFRGRFSLIKRHASTCTQSVQISEDNEEIGPQLATFINDVPNDSNLECIQSMINADNEVELTHVRSSQEALSKRRKSHNSTYISTLRALKRFSPRPGVRHLSSKQKKKRAASSSPCLKYNSESNLISKMDYCEIASRMEAYKVNHLAPTNCMLTCDTDNGESDYRIVINESDRNSTSEHANVLEMNKAKPTNHLSVCDINKIQPINCVTSCKIGLSKSSNGVTSDDKGNIESIKDEATPTTISINKRSEITSLSETSSSTQSILQTETCATEEATRNSQNNLDHINKSDRNESLCLVKPKTTQARTPIERSSNTAASMKAVWTIGSVVVCFTLCWLPFSIHVVVLSYYNYSLLMWPYHLVTWLGYLNSALNPLLYCCNKSIREAVKSLLLPAKYNSHH